MDPMHRDRVIQYAGKLLGRTTAEHFESLSTRQPAGIEFPDTALEIVDRLRSGRELHTDDAFVTEAIILPGLRPVYKIRNSGYEELPAPWTRFNNPAIKAKLTAALRAIGRVNILNHPQLPYAGTGFLVGKNLLLTNRHVASLFTNGLGVRNLTLTFTPQVDLKQEIGSDGTLFLRVLKTTLIHPYWDAAVLTVDGIPAGLEPLQLSSDALNGSLIAVVGYPALDPRNNAEVQRDIFQNVFQKKRLQPGYLTSPRATQSFGHSVEAVTHDASTLGGNSGSAVIDVESGMVAGLHFAGVYLDTNYAVPTWELARDQRLVDLGLRFAPRKSGVALPKAQWLSFWNAVETSAAPAAPQDGGLQVTAGVGDDGSCTWTIPIHVSIKLGTPVRAQARVDTVRPPAPATDSLSELREARRRITEDPASYYDAAADAVDMRAYYSGIDPDSSQLYSDLSTLVTSTHHTKLAYKPTKHLYPLVDLHPDGDMVSIYSGALIDPEELIRTETPLEESIEAAMESGADASTLESLEALLQNSAEHVVPQSWFQQRMPMRGDLHHLFACESRCNSFRGNVPYFQFDEEAVMEDCGRVERTQNKFEPNGGKGAVARATMYFLLRYPGEINRRSSEYTEDRIAMLLQWHRDFAVTRYERHRNREIFRKQGNRNPLIDHADWAESIEFTRGLGA